MTNTPSSIPVLLDVEGMRLSGLRAFPTEGSPRGLVVALHGGGYSAGYWDCPVDGASLLELGARLGFHVIALDRPGYGASHGADSRRLGLANQVDILFDAMEASASQLGFKGPRFLIGHSIGAIITLLMAAHPRGTSLSGADVLGTPIRFPPSAAGNEVTAWSSEDAYLPPLSEELRKSLLFGPVQAYSTQADQYDRGLVRPMSVREYTEAISMPGRWEQVLPTIRLPVQFNAAEFEVMQVTGPEALEFARENLRNSVRLRTHAVLASGHNVSTHLVARSYHLRAISFFEECIACGA